MLFRRDTWHHIFSHGLDQLRVLEFFAPPPSTGTSRKYAQTRPLLEEVKTRERRAPGAVASRGARAHASPANGGGHPLAPGRRCARGHRRQYRAPDGRDAEPAARLPQRHRGSTGAMRRCTSSKASSMFGHGATGRRAGTSFTRATASTARRRRRTATATSVARHRQGGVRGCPTVALVPNAIGIDVGATKVAVALVDSATGGVRGFGELRHVTRWRPQAVLDECVRRCERLAEDAAVSAIGIGVCEIVDRDGAITSASSIDWRDLDSSALSLISPPRMSSRMSEQPRSLRPVSAPVASLRASSM